VGVELGPGLLRRRWRRPSQAISMRM